MLHASGIEPKAPAEPTKTRDAAQEAGAKAASQTARGKFVRSAAQSRKLERNPCVVTSARPIRRSAIRNAILESGLAGVRPGNTYCESSDRTCARVKIATQRDDRGMR